MTKFTFIADVWVQWRRRDCVDGIAGQGFARIHSDELEAVVKKWNKENPRITDAKWLVNNIEFKT